MSPKQGELGVLWDEFNDVAITTPLSVHMDLDDPGVIGDRSDFPEHWPNVMDDASFWLRHFPDPETQVEKHGDPDTDPMYFMKHPGKRTFKAKYKKGFHKVPPGYDVKGTKLVHQSASKPPPKKQDKPDPSKSHRPVTRRDDKRTTQGQTPTGLIDHRTGKPLSKSGAGDAGEALFVAMGAAAVAKFLGADGFEQQAGSAKLRNTPLDIIIGLKKKRGRFRRFAAEVKSVSSTSSGGKPKASIKSAEHDRKMAAIDEDDINNPNLPRAIPLLVGQVITLNPDGSGQARIVIHEGDYPSRGYHLMEEVTVFKFTAEQWAEAIDQGTFNRKRKGLKKASDKEELEPGDWYMDFAYKIPRIYAVEEKTSIVTKSADERIVEPNLGVKKLSGDFIFRELVQGDE
jgi:hypothetical protein